MTQTKNQQNGQPVSDGDRLYDAIMEVIEPDLTIAALPALEEKYAGETEQEHEARVLRYEDALEMVAGLFDRLEDFHAEDVRAKKQIVSSKRKEKEAQERASSVGQLEEKIESLSDDAS